MESLDKLIVHEVSHSHQLRPRGVRAMTMAVLNKSDIRRELFPGLTGNEASVDRNTEVPDKSLEAVRKIIKDAIERGWRFEDGNLEV